MAMKIKDEVIRERRVSAIFDEKDVRNILAMYLAEKTNSVLNENTKVDLTLTEQVGGLRAAIVLTNTQKDD